MNVFHNFTARSMEDSRDRLARHNFSKYKIKIQLLLYFSPLFIYSNKLSGVFRGKQKLVRHISLHRNWLKCLPSTGHQLSLPSRRQSPWRSKLLKVSLRGGGSDSSDDDDSGNEADDEKDSEPREIGPNRHYWSSDADDSD